VPALLTADAPGLIFAFGPPQWGIFSNNGGPILVVDSVASVEYARDYHVSDFPQEQGAFASYNKVQVPFQAKVGFLIGPSRTDFLNAVEAAVASLQFVAVVTPEISYPSANLTHYSYRREIRSGVTLIRVDVWAEEIRIISGNPPDSAQSTNAATPSQSGQVQPVGDVEIGTVEIGEPTNPPLNPPT
jgi:hypothetical protein